MTHGGDVDVLVAGGGPAGLAVAIGAALRGMSVVVVEPRARPVDKACGEGLMPGAVAALRRLGVDLGVEVGGRRLDGIRYLDRARSAEAYFADGHGLGVRRTALHDAMTRRADELGVELVVGAVDEVVQRDGWVDVDGRRARHLVVADGLHSRLRAGLGLDGARPSGPQRYGIRRHYEVEAWTDLVEVHWAAGCEAYVTPVADDLVGVAVLGPRGVSVDDALGHLPALRARIGSARPVGRDRGAGPLRRTATARVAGRVLLVGDAAGYVDALTGEGIRLAVEEAAAAVLRVAEGEPQRYAQDWRRITRTYRIATSTLVRASARPVLRRRVVPAAARFPGVFARCVDVLAH